MQNIYGVNNNRNITTVKYQIESRIDRKIISVILVYAFRS